MKRLAVPALLLGIAALLWAVVAKSSDANTARAESARLRAALDSLATRTARVDTVTVERTRTLTRIETRRDTLRERLTLTDTVEVVRFIAIQDSALNACHAVIESCEEGKRVRDQRIALLDSLNASTERRLRAETARGRRERIVFGIGGAVVGWLAKP